MAIDFHAHLAREREGVPPFLRLLFDVDGYLERQDAAGIELTVLSYALGDVAEEDPLAEAKGEHDFLAELVASNPGRLAALAALDPFGGKAWLEEAERALDSGLSGLCLPTSREGKYLDADEAQDALEFANERGVPVFLHPSESPLGPERTGDWVLDGWIGRPCDTGICLSRMLLADTLARYSNLRMVVAHSGGVIPMLLGRLDHVYEGFKRRAAVAAGGGPPGAGKPAGGGPAGGGGPPPGMPPPPANGLKPSLDGSPPSERTGQLYFDTASYHPAAILAAIEVVGIDRVVVGTDHPPAGASPDPAIEVIRDLELESEDRDKILTGNARQLLNR
jgi:aminocarboxymuconate-semialdehyde decarboxylase